MEMALKAFALATKPRPESERRLLEAANVHSKAGRYAKAGDLYERLIGMNTFDPEFHYLRGESFAARGRYEQAIAEFLEAIKYGGDTAEVCLALGTAYAGIEKYNDAVAHYDKIPAGSPLFARACDEAGQSLRKKNNIDAAIAKYESATKADPRLTVGLLHLAQALNAKGQHPLALDSLAKALEIEPGRDDLHNVITETLPRLENQDEALNVLQRSLDKLAASPEDRVKWAWTAFNTGNFERAFRQALQCLALKAAGSSDLAAKALARLQDRRDALEEVHKVLDDMNDPLGNANWAIAASAFDLGEAEDQIVRAVTRDPISKEVHDCLRGLLWTLDREHSKGVVWRIQHFIDSSGDSLARARWGSTLIRADLVEEGIAQCQCVIDKAALPEAHSVLGKALLNRGAIVEGAAHILEAIRLALLLHFPVNDPVYDISIITTASSSTLNEIPGSAELLTRIGELIHNRHSATLSARWAGVLALLQRYDDSIRELENALRIDPACELAHEQLRALRGKRPDLVERISAIVRKSGKAAPFLTLVTTLCDLATVEKDTSYVESALSMVDKALEDEEKAAQLDAGPVFLAAGEAHRRLFHFGKAIDCYQRAIAMNPGLDWVYYCWVSTIDEIDKKSGLVHKLVKVLNSCDLVADCKVDWQGIRRACEERDELTEPFCRAVERNVDDPYYFFTCGNSLLNQGLKSPGLRLFQRLIELAPKDYRGYYGCAIVLASMNDHQAAIEKLRRAIELESNHLFLYHLLAISQVAIEDYDAALKTFAEVTGKSTFNRQPAGSEDVATKIGVYNDWANCLWEVRKYDEALDKCRLALTLKPNDYWAHFRRAYILGDIERYEDALAAYREAIKSDTKIPHAYHNIAALWNEQGRFRLAHDAYERACSIYHHNIEEALGRRDTYYCLYYGWVLRSLGKLNRAEALYRAALVFDPQNTDVRTSLVKLYREKKKTAAHVELDDSQPSLNGAGEEEGPADPAERSTGATPVPDHLRAVEHYRAAEEIFKRRLATSQDLRTLLDSGELELAMDEHEKATPLFEEALKKRPDSRRAKFRLGQVYLREAKYSDAIRLFEAALEYSSEDLDGRSMLAQAYHKANKLDEAEGHYRRVLDNSPAHIDAWVGLGETYLEMADKLRGKGNSSDQEDFYIQAAEALSEAVRLSASKDRQLEATTDLASAHYLLGYANVQLYELSRLRYRKEIRKAKRRFKECCAIRPDHEKAKRALAKIDKETRLLSSDPAAFSAYLLIGLAIVVFVLAQGLLFFGRPVWAEAATLSARSIASIESIVPLPADADKKLRLIQNVPFQNIDQLVARAKQLVGGDSFAKISDSLLKFASRRGQLQFEQFDLSYYALFTFGSLLFIIAGAYLPQLTSLRFAGLQLDKSTAERVEIGRPIGISK